MNIVVQTPDRVRVSSKLRILFAMFVGLFLLFTVTSSYSSEPKDLEAERLQTFVIGRSDMSIAIVHFSPRSPLPTHWASKPGLIGIYRKNKESDELKPEYKTIDGRFDAVRIISKFPYLLGDISAKIRIESRWGGGRNYWRLQSLNDWDIPDSQYYVAAGDANARGILDCHFFGPFPFAKSADIYRLVELAIQAPRPNEDDKPIRMYPPEE